MQLAFAGALARALLAGLALALSACSTGTMSGGPASPFDLAKDIAAVERHLEEQASINAYYAAGESAAARNAFVSARMSLVDLSYARYISELNATQASTDTAFDVSNVALGVANTVVGGDQDRRVISAISAILTGTRSSVEEAFFDSKTTDVLITQMNGARREVAARIVERLADDVDTYPLAAALVDINEYYIAGTIHGALMNSLTTAANQKAEADARIERLRSVSFTRDASATAIGRWLYKDAARRNEDGVWVMDDGQAAAADQGNLTSLRNWMGQQGLSGVPIATFLTAELLGETRARAIVALNISTVGGNP